MGEVLKDTVKRVALEELNTKVKIKRLLGFLEYMEGSGLGYPISAVFLVKPLSKKITGRATIMTATSTFGCFVHRFVPLLRICIV